MSKVDELAEAAEMASSEEQSAVKQIDDIEAHETKLETLKDQVKDSHQTSKEEHLNSDDGETQRTKSEFNYKDNIHILSNSNSMRATSRQGSRAGIAEGKGGNAQNQNVREFIEDKSNDSSIFEDGDAGLERYRTTLVSPKA